MLSRHFIDHNALGIFAPKALQRDLRSTLPRGDHNCQHECAQKNGSG